MPASLHPDDRALIDLEVAADGASGRFELVPGLVRHDGAFYGGTGLAASVLAMELASGREVLWATTQFISQPRLGAVIEWTVDTLAAGKRSSQLFVRATTDDAVVFTAVGSTGKGAADGLTGTYRAMPKVAPPHESVPRDTLATATNPDSYTRLIELREAELLEPGPDTALWVRRRDGVPLRPAAIGFAADFVPLAIARAAGKQGAGSSLDNSMRFRGGTGTEWALLELDGEFASGGYGSGTVRVWGEDGALLATGGQTAAMRYLWEEGEEPRLPTPS